MDVSASEGPCTASLAHHAVAATVPPAHCAGVCGAVSPTGGRDAQVLLPRDCMQAWCDLLSCHRISTQHWAAATLDQDLRVVGYDPNE